MYHIFLIYSSVNGHLGCFHILAIIINAAMNIEVYVSFRISIVMFFRYISRSGIAGSYGSSIFSFLRNLYTVSTVAATIYIPTSTVGGFPFLHVLANTCFMVLFGDSHSYRCEVLCHCDLDFHFPNEEKRKK